IDCGSQMQFPRLVRTYLRSRGVNRLDGLLLTHGDAAHIGAAANVARVFRPLSIIDNAAPDRSSAHRALLASTLPIDATAAPRELKIGRDLTAQILFPPNEFKGDTADDQAFIIQLTTAYGWRVLLTSDSGEASERWIRENWDDVRSDVLIKGQHKSAPSGSPEFLDCVHPQLIVASSIPFPANEEVREDWAADVAARGIKLFRQDETGAVTLRFFRNRFEAVPFLRRDQTFRSERR
ncbi:MAG TPA: MBL fold metallo-hydrolase, partial [Chthoniobacterales bacterium]